MLNSSYSAKGVEVVCNEQQDGDQHQRQDHGGEGKDNEGELDGSNKDSRDIEDPEKQKERYGNEQAHTEQRVPVGSGVHHQNCGPPDVPLHSFAININKLSIQTIFITYGARVER